MAASSASLWVVLSNLFLLLAVGVLVWKRLWVRYCMEITGILLAFLFSVFHHACAAADIAYCPDESRAVAAQRDVMAAFQLLVFALTPFIDCWLGGPTPRALYMVVMSVVTAFCVIEWQDGWEAVGLLAVAAAVVFGFALWVEYVRRRDRMAGGLDGWWWARFVCLVLVMAWTLIGYMVARHETPGSEAQAGWHGGWHLCGALSLVFSYLLLPDEDERLVLQKYLDAAAAEWANEHASPPPYPSGAEKGADGLPVSTPPPRSTDHPPPLPPRPPTKAARPPRAPVFGRRLRYDELSTTADSTF